MLARLDNNIEHRVLTQDQLKNPPKTTNQGAFGAELDDNVTEIFTKMENKKVNVLEGL